MTEDPYWKCEQCGNKYTFDEFFKLMNEAKRMECECGYIFTRDAWRSQETIKLENAPKIGLLVISVSTIYEELGGASRDDELYETMVFPLNENVDCSFDRRYKTREEAETVHNKIVELIKTYKFKVITELDGGYRIEFIIDE